MPAYCAWNYKTTEKLTSYIKPHITTDNNMAS